MLALPGFSLWGGLKTSKPNRDPFFTTLPVEVSSDTYVDIRGEIRKRSRWAMTVPSKLHAEVIYRARDIDTTDTASTTTTTTTTTTNKKYNNNNNINNNINNKYAAGGEGELELEFDPLRVVLMSNEQQLLAEGKVLFGSSDESDEEYVIVDL